jgi:cell wall-associated NlpC family hydrolase
MCVPISNTQPIRRDLDLREARDVARANTGSEAIVKQSNGDYSVVQLTPEDTAKARNIESANFSPNKVEFLLEGNNDVIINKNASFFDRSKSKLTNGLEDLEDGANTVINKANNVRKDMMNTIETLVDNISDKTNNYVWGGRGDKSFDPEKGISNVDCSGLLNEVFKEAGVNIPYMSTEGLDTYIKNGQGVLRENSNASTIKYGDVINYPPIGKSSGHVMIAAGEPEAVTRNGRIVGYKLNTFDSSPDGTGTRRADSGSRAFGTRGAGFREIFLFTDNSGKVTGLNTLGQESTRGGYHTGVRIGTLKDNFRNK